MFASCKLTILKNSAFRANQSLIHFTMSWCTFSWTNSACLFSRLKRVCEKRHKCHCSAKIASIRQELRQWCSLFKLLETGQITDHRSPRFVNSRISKMFKWQIRVQENCTEQGDCLKDAWSISRFFIIIWYVYMRIFHCCNVCAARFPERVYFPCL